MNYDYKKAKASFSPEGLKAMQAKDMRISFLSIFSSLMTAYSAKAKIEGKLDLPEATKNAFSIVEEMYRHYPTPNNMVVDETKEIPF